MPFRLLCRGVRGLEWVLADEVAETLGAERIELGPREVDCVVPALDARVRELRTADDVFLRVGASPDHGHTKDVPPRLATDVADFDWTTALGQLREFRALPADPRFDVVAAFTGRRNFNRYAVEDAIGAALAPLLGGRFQSRTPARDGTRAPFPATDLTVRIALDGTRLTASLRLAERPLHRRTYKEHTGPGTLHPPLAATLTRLAGLTERDHVLDPFCGDGTIAVEAARTGASVTASDLDPERIAHARANCAAAGVSAELTVADAGQLPSAGEFDAVVTNPPWELAVAAAGSLAGSLRPFWSRLNALLSARGRVCLVTDDELDAPRLLRQRGFHLGLAVRIRLAGRLSHVLLCAPPDRPVPELPPGQQHWRARALAAGLVSDDGFGNRGN